ncbi:MAG: Zeta toxin family protein [Gammaproteobacteria bacterium RIFCSPHIGHO2_12_FULL_41_15]|nr:MAG: Zeta toxin family protein [Gammaproteobacteria bacterium RIFCSPHIGHO2_12_FULL_41_15]
MPQLYMIGGPNGAGKTTVSKTLLPELLNCYEYVNADAIAAALSPFAPETTALQAGRLMLERIHQLAEQKKDFAFETTMASRSFAPFIKQCQQQDYQITPLYLWLEDPNLAVVRVHDRVRDGGHSIPDNVVLRRYKRSINNFLNIYTRLADRWLLFDNSFNEPTMIAEKELGGSLIVTNQNVWNKFKGTL